MNEINKRQFETILSINKTMERVGAVSAPILCAMNRKTRNLTHGALIAALYVVLTHMQNFLVPESASMMIQFRVSEAMCVLAFFTPAAVWGLTVGCFLFNLSFAGALPLDMLVGSLATFLATGGMYLTRKWRIGSFPLLGLMLPAVTNAFLVGWELDLYIGGGFWLNCGCVAVGEAVVLLTLGTVLYYTISRRNLQKRIF